MIPRLLTPHLSGTSGHEPAAWAPGPGLRGYGPTRQPEIGVLPAYSILRRQVWASEFIILGAPRSPKDTRLTCSGGMRKHLDPRPFFRPACFRLTHVKWGRVALQLDPAPPRLSGPDSGITHRAACRIHQTKVRARVSGVESRAGIGMAGPPPGQYAWRSLENARDDVERLTWVALTWGSLYDSSRGHAGTKPQTFRSCHLATHLPGQGILTSRNWSACRPATEYPRPPRYGVTHRQTQGAYKLKDLADVRGE
jgi:hypothetical protein